MIDPLWPAAILIPMRKSLPAADPMMGFALLWSQGAGTMAAGLDAQPPEPAEQSPAPADLPGVEAAVPQMPDPRGELSADLPVEHPVTGASMPQTASMSLPASPAGLMAAPVAPRPVAAMTMGLVQMPVPPVPIEREAVLSPDPTPDIRIVRAPDGPEMPALPVDPVDRIVIPVALRSIDATGPVTVLPHSADLAVPVPPAAVPGLSIPTSPGRDFRGADRNVPPDPGSKTDDRTATATPVRPDLRAFPPPQPAAQPLPAPFSMAEPAVPPADTPGHDPLIATADRVLGDTRPAAVPLRPADATRSPAPPANQIAQAIMTARDGRVSLALDPEELGRVRLVMQPDNDTLRIHILAERPETLDMLRRNIADLASELRQAGLGQASFTFAGSGREGGSPFPGNPGADPLPDDAPVGTVTRIIRLGPATGLDLRL